MKPIIGIAGNERTIEDVETVWMSYTAKNFVTGIQAAGGLPSIIPIGDPQDAPAYIEKIDKLLLGGGHDVTPSLYHQEPHETLQATNLARDEFELALIKEAVRQGKPIFGVCRGMQLLNIAFNGTLYQDLSLHPFQPLPHVQTGSMTKSTHQVTIDEDSLLGQFLPTDYPVNSFHHQTIADVAGPFQVIALAEDGVIEAIQSLAFYAPILAVQWHPELTRGIRPEEQAIFDYFVQKM